jgi:hypothetical protein
MLKVQTTSRIRVPAPELHHGFTTQGQPWRLGHGLSHLLGTRGLTAASGFLPVLLLHLGDSLMNGWMWRPAEAEEINRQAPRAKGGAKPGPECAGPVGLGWSAQVHFGLVRPRFPPRLLLA